MNLRFLLLFMLISAVVIAQKPNFPGKGPAIGRLYGKIVDAATKAPVAYASVVIMGKTSSGQDSLISGGLTEDNGDFNLTSLPMGAYTLNASFIGNKTISIPVKIMPPSVEQDLGDLMMEADAEVLSTVEVKADKATTNMSLEKRVFNVDKNITAAGGTAEDVLKNVPSVSVDMDGNVKLRDKGTTIYLDGKPTLLALNQIPSDQIESVEVISNPSSKYEAATMGGILNIVLKQNRKAGYNGVIGLGIGNQSRYNGMINLNINSGKWNIGTTYSINGASSPTLAYVYRTNLNSEGNVDSYYDQNSNVIFKNQFQNGRINVDYNLDNRNTITVAAMAMKGVFDIPVSQSYQSMTANRQVTDYGVRTTYAENDFNRYNVEAQWKKSYATKNKSLVALLNYGWGDKVGIADWNTTGFDGNGNALSGYPELVKINDGNLSDQLLMQVDYASPISATSKIEMGVRSFWSIRDQNYFFKPYDYDTQSYVTDNQFTQDAKVTESINAAYFMYSGSLKNKINYQAGLRFEQSAMTGDSRLDSQQDFGYSYPKGNTKDILRSLFPSLHISKNIDDATEIGVNFSRKLQRPNQMQIMPGVRSNDKQNIQLGNPALAPEFINLAEINYHKIFGAHNYLASLYFSNETNTIKPLVTPSTEDATVLITQFVNGANQITYGTDQTLKLGFTKNFDVMLNANVFKFNVTVDTFTNSGWTANAKANFNYKLPSNFSIQLNTNYEGNRPMPQGQRKGIFFADFAIKRTFFNNAANVVFSVNDILNSRKDITTYTLPFYIQESMRRRDARYFKIAIQIPFGKADASIFKKSNKKPEGQEMQDY